MELQQKMKSPVICLVGSMKQKDMMDKISKSLTWKGCVVLPPVDMKITEKEIKQHSLEKMMEFFRSLQYQRILLSDLVVAIPKKDGTFGDDSKFEIDFANTYGRMVLKINNPDEIDTEEIKIALSKSKKNTAMDLSTILIEALHIMENLQSPQSWMKSLQDVIVENDKNLFPDYNIARDTMTDILRDAN